MKKYPFFLTLVLFLSSAALFGAEAIQWEKDLSVVLKNAEKKNSLIMIHLYTDWCHWCKELDKRTYTHKRVIDLSEKFVCIRINPEKDGKDKVDFVKQFDIPGFPTILFVDNRGALYGKIGGFLEGEAYAKEMEAVLKIEKSIRDLMEKHEKGDRKSTYKLIDIMYERELYGEAIKLILVLKKEDAMPDEPVYYFILGNHYFENKAYNDAYNSFMRIMNKKGVDSELYYHAAYLAGYSLYFVEGKKEAVAFLKKYKNHEKNPYTSIYARLIQYLESQ
ncbi:MAG: thioredoxin family protein [Spirochaetales bacterium]|nr:thioredoxin family protein [Spirochaetales bacterium]